MKRELSKELQNLLELLVSPDDANFELGKVLLPTFEQEVKDYMFNGNQGIASYEFSLKNLIRTYDFYKFWFSEVDFNKMDGSRLDFLRNSFLSWEIGAINSIQLKQVIEANDNCFILISYNMYENKNDFISVFNKKAYKRTTVRQGELEYFDKELDLFSTN